jgi:hypothetical protein
MRERLLTLLFLTLHGCGGRASVGRVADADSADGTIDSEQPQIVDAGGEGEIGPSQANIIDAAEEGETGASQPQVVDAGGEGETGASLPACHWSSSLESDAAPGSGLCMVQRAFVVCAGSGECLSPDATSCPDVVEGDCHDECATNQYAVLCGGGPPLPNGTSYQDAPDECVAVQGTTYGSEYYCCPCQ